MQHPDFISNVSNGKDSGFWFSGIQMKTDIMNALAPGLRANSFKTLHFAHTNCEYDDQIIIIDLIERNISLKTLSLVKNIDWRSEGEAGSCHIATCLCNAIKNHPSLQYLVMSNNEV